MKTFKINRLILALTVPSLLMIGFTSSPVFAQDKAYLKREAAVKDNMQYARRLENIAGPVLIKNAENCGDYVAPYIGAQFATTDSVAEDYQPVMQNLYGTGMSPTITMIAEQSPASKMLQIGDMIVSINGIELTQGVQSLDEINADIAASRNAALTFGVMRDNVLTDITVQPVSACNVPVRLVNRDDVEVVIDGDKIAVTKAILKSDASDQDIAKYIERELLALTAQ